MRSSRSQRNAQIAILASLLTILAILAYISVVLTYISVCERKQRERRSSFQEPIPLPETRENSKAAQPHLPHPAPILKQTPIHRLIRKRKNALLIAAGLLALIVLLLTVGWALLMPGAHQRISGTQLQSAPPAPTSVVVTRANFERGIVFPRWSAGGYGSSDTTWQTEMHNIKVQTSAQWIEIPVLFSQGSSHATVVGHSQSTADVASFASGVRTAHALGYHVFFVPLMSVNEPGGWSGSINLTTASQQQAWFDSYWNTLKPYVQVAASNGVEQMAIGTELQTLQQIVPAPEWEQLINRVRSTFKNTLTYDMNWSSLGQPQPDWLKDPALAMIGVSSYIPLTDTPQRIDPSNMPALWQQKVRARLDALSTQLGKPVLISEIGYRDSSDALYHTWESHSSAAIDTTEQAGAFEAALSNAFSDPQIGGIFFWGWENVDQFTIKDRPAAQVLLKWYSLPSS